MIDMRLWENYRKVCFIAPFAPPDWSDYAIVTAWNPGSQAVGGRRNARRQRALWRLIQRADAMQAMGPVWGSALDEGWQEESLLLLAPRADAVRLAAAFGQNAIYRVEEGELWLEPVLLKGEPCHLGSLAAHWIVRGPA
ncbi:MAG: DUF3293 domain-containing protein [Aeromonas sp.]|uniref:DUF3293 domain-containing protein n=1 Tax=Aeromonas sp. TaxID=647 RepID=UPI003F34349D